jgi:hypothetical protein
MDHHDPEHRRTGQDGELVEPGVAPTNFRETEPLLGFGASQVSPQ